MRGIGTRQFAGYVAFTAVLALLVLLAAKWAPASRHQKTDRAMPAYLPLSFEVNRGQAAANAKFVAHGSGYSLLLTGDGEPELALYEPARPEVGHSQQPSTNGEFQESARRRPLRVGFLGANAAPQVQGEQPLPGRSNYLIGSDPNGWLIGIPHYARVRYHDVYPGVDVLYYAKDQQLEYDFIVRPGSDSESIRMTVDGALGIEWEHSGNLAVKTDGGSVVLHKPTAYQQGTHGEQEVACNYVLDNGEIRFVLGDHDPSQVLRIDPVLTYSTPLDALVRAIAVDGSGNSYLAGSTAYTNFPTTVDALQPTSGGSADTLVAKLDPTGSTLLFATYLGGSGYESANSVALDSSGNVLVAGSTRSSNFPLSHAFQSTLLGDEDSFLAKLSANGTQLLYSTYLGGSGNDIALGVALDSSGRAVVSGLTSSSNFPTSSGALQEVYGGGDSDAFVAKLDTDQSGAASRLFSTYLGGSNRDAAGALKVDATASVLVTGLTLSSNFPTANPLQASCASCPAGADTNLIPAAVADAFITKLNSTGTALVYSTFLGGNRGDAGNAIALDSIGNVYVAGTTFSWSNFPITAGAFQTSFQQGDTSNAFVTKLNGAGTALMYSTFVGGDYHDSATGIAIDSVGKAYITGDSSSSNFPTVKSFQSPGGGACEFVLFPDVCSDAVVAQLNATGSALVYSTYLGRANLNESGTAIAVDSAGNAYVAGASDSSSGTDLLSLVRFGPPSSAGNNVEPTGFAAKITAPSASTKPTTITLTSSPNPSDQGQSITLTATVVPAGPTGRVSFREGNTPLGFAALNASGVSAFNLGSLSGGNHPIIADYLGDDDFAASTSAALTHVVSGISLSATRSSASVSRGETASFPFTVNQTGTLTSAVALSCSGLPARWNCGFNPSTVPAGSGPTQVTLTLQTSSASALGLPRAPIGRPSSPADLLLGIVVLLVIGAHLATQRHRIAYVPAAALSLLLLVAGCGSRSSFSDRSQDRTPPPTTVNFTVSATSENAVASMPISITVQ